MIQKAKDVKADTEALVKHLAEGTPIDPELAARIHERARWATEEALRMHGVQEISAKLVREVRGSDE